MTHYTINLSRARAKGRNKRAKKAASLLREELERQEGKEISVSNEVNRKIWSRGASKPPRKIDVEIVEADDGYWAVLSDKSQKELSDTSKDESEDSDDEEYTESDYEEALDGTVSEAQEAIEDFEDPDYDKLIQLEEEGKDRKTLLDFLESQQ